ncbi:MAG: electron transfer flavoprotein subunit alpha/FixB family protein [Candidatus Gastranaerophilales bacterium]|nr:electron transfer flavoprotein subunit alpha/FixB family protein [Candidatus Gastranaerophilales bacterium]
MEPNGILIYGELNNDYGLRPVVKQLVTKAYELKPKIWNQRIMVCIIGPRINYDGIVQELGKYGADEAVIVNDNNITEYNPNFFPEIFVEIAQKYPPRIILTGATCQGKEIAAYTAAKLDTGLTADCTNLDIGENNLLLSTRPTFGGQLTADILCRSFPQMATVQENVFKEVQTEQHSASAIFKWFDINKSENKINKLNTIKKSSKHKDICSSDIIIAGGAGACKDNGFALIYQLAQKTGAAVAGSREAFERGFITKSQQIGQTGKTVAPKLYIAVGISGANQHLTGIKNSGKIIAINKDKNAPIFKHADIGIAGDLFEVLPKLIENFDTYNKKEENNE